MTGKTEMGGVSPAVPPIRVLSIGSLPPEMGGARPGGVAAFHGSFLAGLKGYPQRVASVGVIPIGGLGDGKPGVPLFQRPRERSPKDHLAQVVDESKASVVVLNHLANEWGRAVAGLDGHTVVVGINHSWTPLQRTSDSFPADELLQIFSVCDVVVFPSEHCKGQMDRFGGTSTRLEVIPHPLPPGTLPDSPTMREGILFVGNLGPVKNVDSLIKAMTMLPDAGLTIVGEGSELPRLKELTRSHALEDRVHLTGSLPHPKVIELMRMAKVLVLPSHSESFGLVMVEAMAVGTPVVGFGPTLSEIRQRVGIECGIPLGATDPASIARGLVDVLEGNWDYGEIARRTRDAYSNRVVIGRYVELFQDLIRAQKRKSH